VRFTEDLWAAGGPVRYPRPVTKVLVTGMSGTGKSSVLRLLGARGHRSVDTDSDEWSYRVTLPDGSPDWIWREDVMSDLLRSHAGGCLFVAGCKTNQGRFYAQFDHVALLSAPIDLLFKRIASRRDNRYGKTPAERQMILRHVAEVEPLLRATATIEIDASAPLEAVADQLEQLGSAGPPIRTDVADEGTG
jgi:shikimate kinase